MATFDDTIYVKVACVSKNFEFGPYLNLRPKALFKHSHRCYNSFSSLAVVKRVEKYVMGDFETLPRA